MEAGRAAPAVGVGGAVPWLREHGGAGPDLARRLGRLSRVRNVASHPDTGFVEELSSFCSAPVAGPTAVAPGSGSSDADTASGMAVGEASLFDTFHGDSDSEALSGKDSSAAGSSIVCSTTAGSDAGRCCSLQFELGASEARIHGLLSEVAALEEKIADATSAAAASAAFAAAAEASARTKQVVVEELGELLDRSRREEDTHHASVQCQERQLAESQRVITSSAERLSFTRVHLCELKDDVSAWCHRDVLDTGFDMLDSHLMDKRDATSKRRGTKR